MPVTQSVMSYWRSIISPMAVMAGERDRDWRRRHRPWLPTMMVISRARSAGVAAEPLLRKSLIRKSLCIRFAPIFARRSLACGAVERALHVRKTAYHI